MAEKISTMRRHRLDLGYTLDQVSERTGISKSKLSRGERGKPPLQKDNGRTLHLFYECELDLAEILDPMFDFEVGGVSA